MASPKTEWSTQERADRLARLRAQLLAGASSTDVFAKRAVGLDPYNAPDLNASLEGLKRAVLRDAPEGEEFKPLWTEDDRGPRFTGDSVGSDLLMRQYKNRADARQQAIRRIDPFNSSVAGYGTAPQQEWGKFFEGLHYNQDALGKQVRVRGLAAGLPLSPMVPSLTPEPSLNDQVEKSPLVQEIRIRRQNDAQRPYADWYPNARK